MLGLGLGEENGMAKVGGEDQANIIKPWSEFIFLLFLKVSTFSSVLSFYFNPLKD